MRFASKALCALHVALLTVVYGRLVAKAFLRFPLDWDYLAYHLPGALASYGLTSYTPEPRLVAYLAGFPPLPRLVAGALVLATGRLSASSALNVVAVAALCAGLVWLFGRGCSLRWLLTGMLGVPLFVHHFVSGYVDLFTGAWLALALAALAALDSGPRAPRGVAALLVAALAAAVLSKFQAWPVAGAIGIAALLRLLALFRSRRLSRGAWLALAAALVLALAAWPARNLVRFGNPVYPVKFPFVPALFPNASVDADTGVENLPRWLEPRAQPLRFAASVLEWNRFYPGERYHWSLDQGARASHAKSPHHRLGGWFPWTVGWLALGTFLAWRRRRVSGATLGAFAATIGVVSCVPQSHELRYWLFIPLGLAIFTARALAPPARGGAADAALKTALVAGAAFVLVVTRPFSIDARLPEAYAPREARAFWAAQTAQPSPGTVDVCNVNPEGIFWSGPTFREFPVRACFSSSALPPESPP